MTNLTYTQKRLLEGVELYDVEKWIKQNNGAVNECIEGCLTDSYLVSCKRGTAFIYEYAKNNWSSSHLLYYISDKHAEQFPEILQGLYNKWEKLYRDVYGDDE